MATTNPVADQRVRVLLVDDDRDDYLLTRDLLNDIPDTRFQLDHVLTYEQAVEAIRDCHHDIYLFDYLLGAKTGIDLIEEALTHGCRAPVILLTGKGQYEIDRAAMRAGAADYLEKAGLTPALLERSIRYALQQHRYESELERKVQERTEELARANAALKLADQRKDEFLATLAHELRNPLAPIRNALEIMKIADGNPVVLTGQRDMLERQIEVMVRLIEDLLDVARINTGKLRIRTVPMALRDAIESAVEVSKPMLSQAGVELRVELPETPIVLEADHVRLAQVFANLLNNGAKFTPPGGRVTLSVTREGSHAVIRIRDTGIGIPPEVVRKVFDLFTQANGDPERSHGGLGIGLALVKRLVELHGGTVTVLSEGRDKGTEFTVRLPIN